MDPLTRLAVGVVLLPLPSRTLVPDVLILWPLGNTLPGGGHLENAQSILTSACSFECHEFTSFKLLPQGTDSMVGLSKRKAKSWSTDGLDSTLI